MNSQTRRILRSTAAPAVVLLTACLVAWTYAQQPDPGAGLAPADAWVLLLRNGQVIEGRVFPYEDRYQVFVEGGEIRLKQSEVLCCCRTMVEVYQHKRQVTRLDNVQDRLDLAQWCLQVGLRDEAAAEVAAAAAIEPNHPLLPVIDRRLKTAPDVKPDQASEKSDIRGPSAYELDLMVRGMPPRTVEAFAQTIQPALLNSCAAAGCHGQSSNNGFRLLRTPPGSPASRRLTQRNLYAALEWVNRDNPAASPLVAVPMRPHGTARAAIFTDRHVAQYRQLLEWCYRVSQVEAPVLQASFEEEAAGPRAEKKSQPAAMPPMKQSGVVPAAAWESKRQAPRGAAPQANPVQRGATLPKFAPSDPCDPDTFNRQFGPPAADPPLPPGTGN